jgi:hypothetical protein
MKRRVRTPTTTTYADHEVVVPHNPLADAIGAGGSANTEVDLIARAEAALVQLAVNFPDWMRAECDRIAHARAAARRNGLNGATHENLFLAAHDLRGQAATLGFPIAAEAAESLCRLLEHTPDPNRIPPALIDQHVDGIRAIARENVDGRGASIARALCDQLRLVTDAFLVNVNAHRPDYLEGLMGASVIPDKGPG